MFGRCLSEAHKKVQRGSTITSNLILNIILEDEIEHEEDLEALSEDMGLM